MIKISLFVSLLVLASCSNQKLPDLKPPPPLEVIQTIPYDCGVAPSPIGFIGKNVNWKIINFEGRVYYSLNSENYVNLSENTSNILASVKSIKSIIKFYETCIENSKEQL